MVIPLGDIQVALAVDRDGHRSIEGTSHGWIAGEDLPGPREWLERRAGRCHGRIRGTCRLGIGRWRLPTTRGLRWRCHRRGTRTGNRRLRRTPTAERI